MLIVLRLGSKVTERHLSTTWLDKEFFWVTIVDHIFPQEKHRSISGLSVSKSSVLDSICRVELQMEKKYKKLMQIPEFWGMELYHFGGA